MTAVADSATQPAVRIEGVTKRYGGLEALSAVTLDVNAGEVLAIVGDNGAGKTTLIKMLAGVERPTEGMLRLRGVPVEFRSTRDAREQGIEAVYQNLALAEHLPVWANMHLGREIRARGIAGRFGWLNRREMRKRAAEDLEELKVSMPDLERPARMLSGGQRQAIAIVRAVSWARELVLMDEPTAALGPEQQVQVLELIARVRERGTPVVLVSHSLPQVLEIADRIAVFRRGQLVRMATPERTSGDELIAYITGMRGGERFGLDDGVDGG